MKQHLQSSLSSFSAVTNEDNNIDFKNEVVQRKNDESKEESQSNEERLKKVMKNLSNRFLNQSEIYFVVFFSHLSLFFFFIQLSKITAYQKTFESIMRDYQL